MVTCILLFIVITAITRFRIILTGENSIYLLIPSIELILAAALIIPRTGFKAIIATAMIQLLWTICNGYCVMSGEKLPFSYGGIHESFNRMEHFYLSAAMLLLSCMGTILFLINSYHDNRSSRIPV